MKIDWASIHTWIDNFVDGGWRKTFFWVSVSTMAIALFNIYVVGTLAHKYPPEAFLTQFNVTMGIVTALAFGRGVEKALVGKASTDG